MNQQNPQSGIGKDERLFEEVLEMVDHWYRVHTVRKALKEIAQSTHPSADLAKRMVGRVATARWNHQLLNDLTALAKTVRTEKRQKESQFSGRTAQRAARTAKGSILAELVLAIIESCESSNQPLPKGVAELVAGQNFPFHTKNNAKRLRAALITAIDPKLNTSARAARAGVDRGALAEWDKDEDFKALVSLISQDEELAATAAKLS